MNLDDVIRKSTATRLLWHGSMNHLLTSYVVPVDKYTGGTVERNRLISESADQVGSIRQKVTLEATILGSLT